ncbi:molybdopterin molybdotransferase MoeA [Candidatus Poribacteria bacterium]|nr:molybdopterin molybdotransferase MoeA [Candidatus Poribacteria bacterium]
MLTVEEAREKVLNSVTLLNVEKKHILECLGYVLAEDVYADYDIPPFDNSQMDGFAVIAEDVAKASPDNPVTLKVVENLPAGYAPTTKIIHGQAARIMTGAMMPEGADAVVMVEDTQTGGINSSSFLFNQTFSFRNRKSLDGRDVKIFNSAKKGEYVRFRGEGIKAGELVLAKGKVLRPPEMAMLATLNCAHVAVYKRPRVALMSTGDELTPLGEALKPGMIRDSNRYGLYGQVLEAGGFPIDLGIAIDRVEILEAKFRAGLEQADVLVTSGGVSVGDYDIVKDVLSKLGEINFWKVAMKPGKPQAFGVVDGKPIFGLPGNPVSSLVVFELFVRPALLKMAGHTDIFRPTFTAIMEDSVTNDSGRVYYARAIIEKRKDKYYAKTTGSQSSGILLSLVLANGLIIIPVDTNLEPGDEVEALLVN